MSTANARKPDGTPVVVNLRNVAFVEDAGLDGRQPLVRAHFIGGAQLVVVANGALRVEESPAFDDGDDDGDDQ